MSYEDPILLSKFLILGVVAGLLGALVMASFMQILSRRHISHADIIRVIGSIFTRSRKSAPLVGGVVHLVVGVVFGILYLSFFWFLSAQGLLQHLVFGALAGTAHGFVVGMLLVVVVAEHHPLEEYRNAGIDVAVAYLAGHFLFGVTVGAVAGIAQIMQM